MNYYSQSGLNAILQKPFRFEEIDDYLSVVTDPELSTFLLYLKKPNAVVFIGWMEQWREVMEIIREGGTSISFVDKFKVREHVLFQSFQEFITPFLFSPLQKRAESGVLDETLEYIVLLETDSRVIVEYTIHNKLNDLFVNISTLQSQKSVTEEELIGVVHDVVNEQIIGILNAFSKRSYMHVIAYVESCFKILESRGCTLRMANWIVKQLQELQLNPEHLQQLLNFREDLKNGAFTVENKGKKQEKFRLKPWLKTLGILFFTGVTTWLIVFKPWSEQVTPQEKEIASSFTEFTVEERKHIDSLVNTIQPEPILNLEVDDPYIEGRELMVDARKTISNQVVHEFYEAWETYLSSDTIRSEPVCKTVTKSITSSSLPDGFALLTEKENGKPAFFRNESEYTTQIIVFNNNPGNKPYYYELKKDAQIEFNLGVGEHVGVIAGKYAVPYENQMKSIVFCQFDNATFASLITMYVLKPTNSYNYKFLITGQDIYDYQLIDMYGVLEVH